MPEIDLCKCKIIRRGPDRERKLTLSILRKSQDLTQAQIAERAGISQSEISRAEQRSDCLLSTIDRYAKALGGELRIAVRIGGRDYPISMIKESK